MIDNLSYDESGLLENRPDKTPAGKRWLNTDRGDNQVSDGTRYRGQRFSLTVEYDFAVDGGAVGDINLGEYLPDNAVVESGSIDVVTTLTSSGDNATVAVTAESAGDIVAAVAIDDVSNPWDAGGQDIIPDGTGSNAVKTTAERQLKITVGVEALTAGKMTINLNYFVSS